MADVNFGCTVSKCTTRVDERFLSAGGNHFLVNAWVTAVRAGTTTKCYPHYLDTDAAAIYLAYFRGAGHRGNREKS
jgi:hypothetical protein